MSLQTVPASMTTEGLTAAAVSATAAAAASTKAEDSAVVHLAGSETISGAKTFSTQPVLPQRLTQATAVNSTSGAVIDYTSIPSWVKRITVMFNGVSTSGSSTLILQLGTSSGFDTTGYLSTGWDGTNLQTTTGIALSGSVASGNTRSGVFTLANVSGNVWVGSGILIRTDSATGNYSGGNKTLAGVLDRIRVTTVNGTDTFDAGSVNIIYE